MEPEEQLRSFPYEAVVDGIEHDYRITENDWNFGVKQGCCGYGTVGNNAGRWTQSSGKPMSKALPDSICEHIESHHDGNQITN
jgi:hypothetical protein